MSTAIHTTAEDRQGMASDATITNKDGLADGDPLKEPKIDHEEYKTWWELALHVGAWKDHDFDYVHFGSEAAVRAYAILLLRQRDEYELKQFNTIESLRQQLADMTAERDAYMRDYGKEQDRKREVAQQLADSQKREAMLRGWLSRIAFSRTGKCTDLAQELFDREDWAAEALAATDDLDGLILCDAKPMAWTYDKGPIIDVGAKIPLYRAWEPK